MRLSYITKMQIVQIQLNGRASFLLQSKVMMILIILIMMMLHIVCKVIRFYFAPHVIVNAEAGYDKISDL